MVQSLWRTVWRFLNKLRLDLPYDPAIPLLGVCPEKNIIQKDKCTPGFIAARFTIVKTEATKMPMDRGMDKEDMVHIYNRILLGHQKE